MLNTECAHNNNLSGDNALLLVRIDDRYSGQCAVNVPSKAQISVKERRVDCLQHVLAAAHPRCYRLACEL